MTTLVLKVPKHQAGFSLTEMTFVVIIIGVLYHYFALWLDQRGQALMITHAIDGFALIDEAAYAYYLRPNMNHSWPADIDTLRQSDYLPAEGGYTGFYTPAGQPRSYELEPALFSGQLFIKTTFNTAGQVAAVAAAFPTNGAINPDNDASTFDFQISIPIPGAEYAHRQFLKKSAGPNERMTGNLYLGRHNIEEVNQIRATTLRGNNSYFKRLWLTEAKAVGGTCATGQIGRTASGGLLSCDTPTRRFKVVGGGSQVKIIKGITDPSSYKSRVYPPEGYSTSQCAITVSGPPAMVNNERNDRQTFTWHARPNSTFNYWEILSLMRYKGWGTYTGDGHKKRVSRTRPNALVDFAYYAIICSKDI